MSSRCPICGHANVGGAARCEKCKAWLTQTADIRPAPAAASLDAAPLDAAFSGELLELVRTGRKIEAIRRFREVTGAGLREAKDAVEALEAGRQVSRFEGVPPPPASMSDKEILALVRGGNLIAAIKLHRERTGDGLKDAKEAVEALARAHGLDVPQGGVGCRGVAIMLALGLVLTIVVGGGLVVFGKLAAQRVWGL